MNNTCEALLQAIIADPADISLRLICADWLEEHSENVPCDCYNGWHIRSNGDSFRCQKCHGAGFVPHDNALRSEFIRVQCELAKLDDERIVALVPSAKNFAAILQATLELKRYELRRRESELLPLSANYVGLEIAAFHDFHGTTARVEWLDSSVVDLHFRCGFVEGVTCDFDDWAAHAKAIRDACPLREVTFTDWPNIAVPGWDAESFALANRAAAVAAIKRQLNTEFGDKIEFHLP